MIGDFGKAIARQLSARRAHQGLTQADLADATGISQSQLSKQLRGIRAINIDELDAICRALDIEMAAVIELAEDEVNNVVSMKGRRRPASNGSRVQPGEYGDAHDDLVERINAGLEPVAAQEATEPLEEHQP